MAGGAPSLGEAMRLALDAVRGIDNAILHGSHSHQPMLAIKLISLPDI